MSGYVSAELRRAVIKRANSCCEYCLLSQDDYPFSYHIEHIIAEKHGGKTQLQNLALSCPPCNSFKGTDFASFDPITEKSAHLFNPRNDVWGEHFIFEGTFIEGRTIEGRVTAFLLRFNIAERVKERELLWNVGTYPCY